MAEFNNEAGDVTESDILAAFGMSEDEPSAGTETETSGESAPNPETDPNEGSETGSSTSPEGGEQQPEGTGEAAKETPAAIPPADNKQNQAFARMRTENAAMQRTLAKMAQVLGVDPKLGIDQLSEQLSSKATAALAKQQGIDPQLAARLEHLEDINRRYEEQQLGSKLESQFRELQEKFGATTEEITKYANDLVQAGYNNSNIGSVDIVNLYLRMHFDEIVKARVDKAVANEQARSTKAGDASQPGKKTAPAENKTEETIDSVHDLESLFSELT